MGRSRLKRASSQPALLRRSRAPSIAQESMVNTARGRLERKLIEKVKKQRRLEATLPTWDFRKSTARRSRGETLQRSSKTGFYRSASHHGIWQQTAALPQANFLLDNRVGQKRIGEAKFMAMPLAFNTTAVNSDYYYGRSPASSRASYYGDNNGQLDRYSSQGEEKTSHDTVRAEQRKKSKTRMGRILCPNVSAWKSLLRPEPRSLVTTDNFEELLSQMRSIQAAGGSGGDLGRGKHDVSALQDLITTQGRRYGEKMMNAALETQDREDEMTVTRFPRLL